MQHVVVRICNCNSPPVYLFDESFTKASLISTQTVGSTVIDRWDLLCATVLRCMASGTEQHESDKSSLDLKELNPALCRYNK